MLLSLNFHGYGAHMYVVEIVDNLFICPVSIYYICMYV